MYMFVYLSNILLQIHDKSQQGKPNEFFKNLTDTIWCSIWIHYTARRNCEYMHDSPLCKIPWNYLLNCRYGNMRSCLCQYVFQPKFISNSPIEQSWICPHITVRRPHVGVHGCLPRKLLGGFLRLWAVRWNGRVLRVDVLRGGVVQWWIILRILL